MSQKQPIKGTCPECGGLAEIFRFPGDDNDEGHVYCQEDDCGWIQRSMSRVSRYIWSDD